VSENLTFKSLGLRDYDGVWQSMKSHIREENFKNEIWFLEHTPVFTLGTAADQKDQRFLLRHFKNSLNHFLKNTQ